MSSRPSLPSQFQSPVFAAEDAGSFPSSQRDDQTSDMLYAGCKAVDRSIRVAFARAINLKEIPIEVLLDTQREPRLYVEGPGGRARENGHKERL